MKIKNIIVFVTVLTYAFTAVPALAADETRSIVFPVEGEYNFSDSFGDPRSGGRVHEGVDIFAKKMTPLVSAVDGYVASLPQDEPSYGYAIVIRDADRYSYHYLHVNNDTPGTDDGLGGTIYAYAPTIIRGARVVAGQLIGWVGDSGNAENVGPHLHFEIRLPNGDPINPYQSLINASQPGTFNPVIAKDAVTTINDDKTLIIAASANCQSNTLIKSTASSAVYYCGADGKRYVFPTQKIYNSWYADFKSVVTISVEQLANVPLGGNVTYRPGVRMVKIETEPNVYAVDRGGVLRYVQSPEIAASMYGTKWNQSVDDLSVAFFVNYQIGEPITRALR